MSKPFVPIETADIKWNKNLPFSNQYDDIYFSMESGIQQSRYVFIDGNDLINRWLSLKECAHFSIAETGFGTGLNFLLTWSLWKHYAPKSASLHFISCEKNPLKVEDIKRALSNWPELESYSLELLKQYPILTPGNHHLNFSDGRVKLTLMLGDCFERFEQLLICGDSLIEYQSRNAFIDAWYLDGFAPKKNESMWSKSLFQVVAMLSKQGTTIATYTAAATVKSALAELGFTVIKKKGFGIKRHMLTGYLEQIIPSRLKYRSTPWHNNSKLNYKEKTALIIGAGLAGCFAAHCLANRGWKVIIIEKETNIAEGASANPRAVLFPKLSTFHSPLTEFMLAAFLFAQTKYRAILVHHHFGDLKGALTLPFNKKELKAQKSLVGWLSIYPELGQLVKSDEASALAGVPIKSDCLYIPTSGWLDSPALCDFLITHKNISLVKQKTVNNLSYQDEQWSIAGYSASVLVLANGFEINQFKETTYLPIKPIRGQMTSIAATKNSRDLKIPVCGEGHVVPAIKEEHYLGASYELGISNNSTKAEDDKLNLEKLEKMGIETFWSTSVRHNWAGVRASTPDYLPLMGPIARKEDFLAQYAGLESNAKRWIAKEPPCYPNLYAFAGFGSRGLTTIPLCAEWLAAMINNEISGAPRNLLQALAPSRFLRRNITRGIG
ncbi:bifunctional tRNA (5-methylaminomethyl-2-thiouridine)(34)-methyltransferase MnmD/FAD-dependent 5-carboxymethylaminomethyl-2-thiouridine(34) oxidoreductase MnmC [Legionella sp. km772]|uniref:bifunctional tRNA (5-methylaminomethyl-2-thiouridine)(34)-methyltransferase MnmD/FAD-dependent 5-carboxymethylaminomethyl-2-thiouridine(34) oxidoreductase MnmC n=1 Tax=Legionella sp. km772 TaxID=2498111 RepID=UPI000F8F7A9A|nr:bifunctional tRNA (5-methylaminomethyl-2-thiouridine)(34)-methyltransferase MnmD/FAD-dependent 5-carboxymethylaminomethyl-2-thiouridine(34) oxidoreductase MnmC [Legionella sp. km772]RUR12216.1 bifunctional tRNA (5-methylaminomethyl-2-thiouridine)(34)-methyltransferase MnmD/FAD-dependent 5-carboxymethylaminomethyl-2-thiouridine(34) oxidoreductase MnmC [Legionella sp. km772]